LAGALYSISVLLTTVYIYRKEGTRGLDEQNRELTEICNQCKVNAEEELAAAHHLLKPLF
jgi:hypothetical protein